jgi:hypothetical protein
VTRIPASDPFDGLAHRTRVLEPTPFAGHPDIPDSEGMAHYRAVVRSSAPAGDVYAYLADF